MAVSVDMVQLQASKKRKVMTFDERIRVINLSNQGKSARKIAASFGVGKTQVQTIIRNKNKIIKEWENGMAGNTKRKYSKVRKTKYDDLNKLVWEWFCVQHTKGIQVSGRLLKSKALAFSLQLNHKDFMASNGWLESFKNRHNIRWPPLNGEVVDNAGTNDNDTKKIIPLLNGNARQGFTAQDRADMKSCSKNDDLNWEQYGCAKNGSNSMDGRGEEQDENVVDAKKEPSDVVSVQEAARMVAELRKFGLSNNKPEIVEALLTVEIAIKAVQQVKFDNQRLAKQSNLTSIFRP